MSSKMMEESEEVFREKTENYKQLSLSHLLPNELRRIRHPFSKFDFQIQSLLKKYVFVYI